MKTLSLVPTATTTTWKCRTREATVFPAHRRGGSRRPHADRGGREPELQGLALAPLTRAGEQEQDALLVAERHACLVAIPDEQERLDRPAERVAVGARAQRHFDVLRPH